MSTGGGRRLVGVDDAAGARAELGGVRELGRPTVVDGPRQLGNQGPDNHVGASDGPEEGFDETGGVCGCAPRFPGM